MTVWLNRAIIGVALALVAILCSQPWEATGAWYTVSSWLFDGLGGSLIGLGLLRAWSA